MVVVEQPFDLPLWEEAPMIVPPDPNEAIRYRFDGIYAPLEASNYLRAGLPEKLQRQQPPTSQRIIRWVRGGLVAADRSHEKGREIILNFEDFITCQAITIFYEAGH